MSSKNLYKLLSVFLTLFAASFTHAQEAETSTTKPGYWYIIGHGSIYFSWGYNTEWYTRSTLHVKQSSLQNDYELESVKAHDHRGWDEGLLQKALTIPQYNYRLGYFFNEKQDLGFEINFDHTKYIITDNQDMTLKGKLNGADVKETIHFSEGNGFSYFLNNGANFLLFNLVKRFELYNTRSKLLRVDLLTKAGVGPVIPHVQNVLFGEANHQGFQFGGWNTGLETTLRVSFLKYGFWEISQKVDYARYSNLRVYEGRANQAFGCYELIMNLGFMLPTGKHNVLYTAK